MILEERLESARTTGNTHTHTQTQTDTHERTHIDQHTDTHENSLASLTVNRYASSTLPIWMKSGRALSQASYAEFAYMSMLLPHVCVCSNESPGTR